MDLIVGHVNADFDALASMVAAGKLYPGAVKVLAGSVNRNVREFLALHGDVLDLADSRAIEKEAIERLIMVDNRIASRLGDLEEVAHRPGVEVFIYDHHPPSPADLRGERVRDYGEEVGATVTILLKIIRGRGIPVTPFEATLFALGIHEDTGSLTFAGTTPDDAEALAFAMRAGANVNVVARFLGKPLTSAQHELMRQLLEGLCQVRVRGVLVTLAKAELGEYVEGSSLVANKLAELENLDVLFTLVRMNDRVVVVGLSRLPQVNVDRVLSRLGGGGHPQAASAVIRGRSPGEVEGELLTVLEEEVRALSTAGEIMSGPLRTIPEDTPIFEASRRMSLTGHTAFPVVDGEGRLVGMISRKDLDKAAHHGLGHAPVKGFMTRRLVTVEPEASLQEVQRLMMENAIGRVLVVEGGRALGIVTRKDLLRALHGADYLAGLAPGVGEVSLGRGEVVDLMQRSLSGETMALLREISELASREGCQVYLVGGVVRDLLLGYPLLDLDVVVEGNGIAFAQSLASHLRGKIRTHPKFGTAVVILPTGRRIDVATARTEFYEEPASLPVVERSSIRQDLYRRDFTINAMAVALTGRRFGELLDFFGGLRDLQEGRIRILHNLSFVEDPTRIFRGVRFEQRYGFRMESQTEILARRAVEMEMVGRLTNARVRDELIDICSEPHPLPLRCFRRLEDLGALRALHPRLEVDAAVEGRFLRLAESWEELRGLLGSEGKGWLLSMAALLSSLPPGEAERWCRQMRFRRDDRDALLQCLRLVPGLLRDLEAEGIPPSRVTRWLDPLKRESLTYLYALGGPRARERMIAYLERWSRARPEVTGRDLEAMGLEPSPLYSRILGRLRDAVLDGEVKGREEELRLVWEYLREAGFLEAGSPGEEEGPPGAADSPPGEGGGHG
jgi:tRNA nucleotidyltransferase (CCA-adding enzyme)